MPSEKSWLISGKEPADGLEVFVPAFFENRQIVLVCLYGGRIPRKSTAVALTTLHAWRVCRAPDTTRQGDIGNLAGLTVPLTDLDHRFLSLMLKN